MKIFYNHAAKLIYLFLINCISFTSAAIETTKAVDSSKLISVKIGYIGGLSGRESGAASRSLMALKLLVDKYNSFGGILGRPIELIILDNKSQVAANYSLFQKAKNHNLVGLVGFHTSNSALVASDLAELNHLPTVVASATHPNVSRNRNYVVQVCFTDDVQGMFLGDFVAKNLRISRIAAIVDVSDSASMRVAKSFLRRFSRNNGIIINKYQIRADQNEFSKIVQSIKNDPSIEGLFIAASAIESSFLIKQLTTNNVNLPIIGTDNWQNQNLIAALKNLGQNNGKAYFAAHWYAGVTNSVSNEFIKNFYKNYGETPNSFDADPALTYDSGILLLESIRKAKSTNPEKVSKILKEISVVGATGKIKIGKRGFPEKNINILQINNGNVLPIQGRL